MKKYIKIVLLSGIFITAHAASDSNKISDKAFIELKEFIRNHGGQPERIDPRFWLHIACQTDNLDAVKYLIESKTIENINLKNTALATPLHISCYEANNIDLINYLLYKGADINNIDINGFTPLDVAINKRKWHIVKLFITRYPEIIDRLGTVTLSISCEEKSAETFFTLIQSTIFHDFLSENKADLIFKACKSQNLKIIKYLLKTNKYLISEKDTSGKYCLNYLQKQSIKELLNFLEFHKIELKPEYFGTHINNLGVITFLLQQNISINSQAINELLDSKYSTAGKIGTLMKFNSVKERLTKVIKTGTIEEIEKLERITFFFSPMQISELIIEHINSENYNEDKAIELIKLLNPKNDLPNIQDLEKYCPPTTLDLIMLQHQSYDLAIVVDKNMHNILYHSLAKGLSRRNLSLFLIFFCKDTIFNGLEYDNNDVFIELAAIYKIFIAQPNKKIDIYNN